MDWKNQLTKTPYLVLFIVLITVGVGTASALITITLSGDVHVTGDTTLDGELFVGTDNPNDDDKIWFDGGEEFIMWDDSQTQFEFRDDIVTGDVIQSGNAGPNAAYNRIGIGDADSGFVTTNDDLYIKGDLETDGEIYCPNCILGFYKVSNTEPGVFSGTHSVSVSCDSGDIATGGGSGNTAALSPWVSIPLVETGWHVAWIVTNAESHMFTAHVKCADYPPAHVP